MVTIYINGQRCIAQPGDTIIEVADAMGVAIPRFCYHKKLTVAANCRMCLVEVVNSHKPLPACATPVVEGMHVLTDSATAKHSQETVMEFLLANHPLDCPICDQGGECELQDVAMAYGRNKSRFDSSKRSVADENLGSLIATNMTRCIHCTRCVRFGVELAGIQELGATGRGEHMRIGTYVQHSLQSEVSGNIIDLCPVGALTSKPYAFQARAWELQQTAGIAPHDSLGSNVWVHSLRGRVLRVVPRSCEHLNESWLSDRDRFSYLGLTHPERLTKPMLKINGQWHTVSWRKALHWAAVGLKKVIEQYGPQQLGGLISPNVSLEELFAMQQLIRALGSRNIDHRLRQRDMSDQASWPVVPVLPVAYESLERCDCVVLIGCDMQAELPLATMRLRKAVHQGGQVWVVGTYAQQLHIDIAGQWLAHPQQMVPWLAAMVEQAHSSTTKASAQFTRLCQALHQASSPLIILGAEAQQHPQAAILRYLGDALAKAVGGRAIEWPVGSNAVGAWAVGAVPHRLPGGQIDDTPGLDSQAMSLASLKGYLFYGFEPEADMVQAGQAVAALHAADWVIGCHSFYSKAMLDYADVLLPIAAFTEYDGTMINLEGFLETYTAAVSPPEQACPGWAVLEQLSEQLGLSHRDSLASLQQAVREILPPLQYQAPNWPTPVSAALTRAPITLQLWSQWSIYQIDGLTRRALALQQTPLAAKAVVRINESTLQRYHLTPTEPVTVVVGEASLTWPLVIDAGIADDVVLLPAGMAETAIFVDLNGSVQLLQGQHE